MNASTENNVSRMSASADGSSSSMSTRTNVVYRRGYSPYINDDGYWMEYSLESHGFINTGVKAKGEDGAGTWSDLEGKPSTFPPSAHNHTKSQITDFPEIPVVPTDEIAANTSARHSHSNKNILDGITQTPLYEHQSLSGYVQTNDSRLSDARTPLSHTHSKSQITDFPTIPVVPTDEISANTSARHSHSNKNILDAISGTPLYEHQSLKTINNQSIVGTGNITIQGGSGASTWEEISGKPDTFPPSSHEHQVSEISDFPSIPTDTAELTNGAGFLTEHQSLANYVQTTDSRLSDSRNPNAHTHSKSEITDFSHTHTKSEITDFPTIPTVPTAEITANTNARHTHSNKSILDGITSAPITSHQSLKTINGNSLVGTGNIEISGGGGGDPTIWDLIGTVTGTTALTLDLTNYNEVMVVHRGKVSTSATADRIDCTTIPVSELTSEVELVMGGASATPAGLYGACCKISSTKMTPQWVYIGGAAVSTSLTQTWKVYARKNSVEEVISNGTY